MKKKSLLITIAYLFFITTLFSNNTINGIRLCDSVYSFFNQSNISIKKQQIVNSVDNDFPYNLYIDIPAKKQTQSPVQTLLITFFMEDIPEHKQIIFEAINYAKKQQYNFNLQFLFAYGDNSALQKHGNTSGSESFINHISVTENLTSIIFNFHSKNNGLVVSSRGTVAPSWLIANEANIFLKNHIYSNLSSYVVSQIYRYSFLIDDNLDSFFSRDIPGIKINLNPESIPQNIIREVIEDSITAFSETTNLTWEKHYILIDFLRRYHIISETLIVKIIISIFFIFSIFIFILFFVTSINKFTSFTIIKRIWYTLPVTLIITIITFFLAKFGFNLFGKNFSETGKIYFLIGNQISLAFTSIAFYYYLINTTVTNFEERSIDYLIILSTLFNTFFFLLIDISLFPIFLLIFLLSIFCLIVQNKYFHILFFIFSIVIFVPYLHRIISNPVMSNLGSFLIMNYRIIFIFTLILCPIFLTYFRIITSFRYSLGSKTNLVLFTCAASTFIILVCASVGIIRTRQINKTRTIEKNIIIKSIRESNIDITYTDKTVFTDLIRTIYISMDKQAEQCEVRIESDGGNPILYSENSFEILNNTTSFFNIPDFPPETLKFSYGASKNPCTIIVTVLYKTDEEKEYIMDRKSIKIE